MSENEGDNTPETVAVPKQQYDEMVEKLANSTQATSNLVLEIKELRSKNQITEAEATELKKKLAERNEGGTPQDLNTDTVTTLATEAARKILSERDEEDSKQNKELALKAFLEKHKEFHPENDEGGLKLSSLERKLSRFNQFGLKSVEDFSSVLEDAFP